MHPSLIAHDQGYFWSAEWQAGEAEALRELADGKGVSFESGSAAAAWLLGDD